MSTRQMAQYYSRMGGHGGGFPNLDLFGLGEKRRLREAESMQGIETKAQTELENTKAANARQLQELIARLAIEAEREKARAAYVAKQGLSPYDPFGNVNPRHADVMGRLDPIALENAVGAGQIQGLRTGMEKGYLESDIGKSDFLKGQRGLTLGPAAETAKKLERRVGPNEVAQFADVNDLTAPMTTGIGGTMNTVEYETTYDANGQPVRVPSRMTSGTPGMIHPSPDQVAKQKEEAAYKLKNDMSTTPYNTGGGMGMGSQPAAPAPLKTGTEANLQPTRFGGYDPSTPDKLMKLILMLRGGAF